jgi:hypothetical protein
MNVQRRIERIEERIGVEQEHFVLIISCADPSKRAKQLQSNEILPGVYALPYGGALSSDELEELRDKYRIQPVSR